MKKLLLSLSVFTLLSSNAFAGNENNIGSCGWGSKLFAGQRGIAPQVLGATTNGTSGNQTFAITSGTSGCTQDGLVTSNWKTVAFIDGNKNQFAIDVARGSGETIASLADILDIPTNNRDSFAKALKDNFDVLFASADVTSEEIANGIDEIVKSL